MTTKSKSTEKEIVPVKKEDDFSRGLFNIQSEIAKIFPEEVVKIIMKIAHEISVIGLSEKEAVLISGYDYSVFQEMKKKHPLVQQLIELKDLQYKRDLLKNLSNKGKNSDDKVAQWLLEARYPNEYNKRKGGGGKGSPEDGGGMIAAAIEFVKKTGDSNGMVGEESGRAFIIKTKKGQDIIKDIQEVLN